VAAQPLALIILSACELAIPDTHPVDELLGLAAALPRMGTRTVINSVVPVPDAAARPLVLALHRESALTGFVCLGA